MAVFTSVATVSARYYEKRNRSVAELNIVQMCQTLGRPVGNLRDLAKPELIRLALRLHGELPG